MRPSVWFMGAATASLWCCPLVAAPVALSPATAQALRDKALNANLLLLREVQACRSSAADPYDCLELMLVAAERDSGYHSYDEQQEGLPANAAIAAEARKLLLARHPDGDAMIGLEGSTPIDPAVLLQMERATPSVLESGAAGAGRLLNAAAQRLHDGGAGNIASRVINPVTAPAHRLVADEYGPLSLEAAGAFNNAAAVAGTAYALPESIDLLMQAVAIRTRLLGPDDPATAVAMHNLAAVRGARGETAEAVRLARAAHSALLAKAGAADRRTITAALLLGSLLADDGDSLQGAAIARTASADLAKVAPASGQLAKAYLDLARIDTALTPSGRMALLEQAARILENGSEADILAPLRALLEGARGYPSGIFLVENDKAKVQEGNAQEVALIERVRAGERKTALAGAYQRIAREMLDQKRFDEATAVARKAVALDPTNDAAKVIPVYAAINGLPVGQPADLSALNEVQVMILNYGQSGRALSPEVVEAHVMLALAALKSYGPFGAVGDFEKAAAIVRQRLTGRSNFDAKSRRDLEALRPVFRGQVMVNFAAASQLPE